MPIFINDYEWSQQKYLLSVKIGLRNTSSKNADIVIASSYLKVNFNPYIFEAFLSHKIDAEASSSRIRDGSLYFDLKKLSDLDWEVFDIKPSKKVAQRIRKESLEEFKESQNKKLQKKLESKREISRLAVSKQIERNEEILQQRNQFLAEETKKFFSVDDNNDSSNLRSRRRLSSVCSEEGSGLISEGDYDGDEESIYYSSLENIPAVANQTLHRSTKKADSAETKASKPVIPVRRSMVLKISHTPHKVGVPKRISTTYLPTEITGSLPITDDELQKVIANGSEPNADEKLKIVKANGSEPNADKKLKIVKANGSEPNADEKLKKVNVEDLMTRAKKHYDNDEHTEATELYTRAIEMSSECAALYSNRAASYLALNLNEKAVKDCTKGLLLLDVGVAANNKSRLLCLVRRGTAYVQLHNYRKGLEDYQAARQLDPKNTSLVRDVKAISSFLNTSSDTGEEDDRECSSEDSESCIEENP